MIFGKTENHKLVFSKDKKAKQPKQSSAQAEPEVKPVEKKPLTPKEEI